jgi:hypothetical protein
MLIRIPALDSKYALEFDAVKITGFETPREVADIPGEPGKRKLTGPNSLILHFATLEDAPKWVPVEDVEP